MQINWWVYVAGMETSHKPFPSHLHGHMLKWLHDQLQRMLQTPACPITIVPFSLPKFLLPILWIKLLHLPNDGSILLFRVTQKRTRSPGAGGAADVGRHWDVEEGWGDHSSSSHRSASLWPQTLPGLFRKGQQFYDYQPIKTCQLKKFGERVCRFQENQICLPK